MKPAILITGAYGQLGNEFRFLSFTNAQFQFIFSDVDTLDITKLNTVRNFFVKNSINYVVNCAAYTAVDKAETEIKLATRINVAGARNLAKVCNEIKAVLIQISTDYVYHNRQNTPFVETDVVSPKSIYAKTKLAGDKAVLKYNNASMVLRTSWLYGTFGHNFAKTMLRLGKEKTDLNVVFDQIGTPTYARDLAKAILQIIHKIESNEVSRADAHGIWHYSNEGVTSWFDFAQAIFDVSELPCLVHPIVSAQYPTPAARPPFSVLNKDKIKKVFGIHIPHWQKSLRECLQELRIKN